MRDAPEGATGGMIVSQLGARMHYAVPRILAEAGRLERCYTDICGTQSWSRLLGALPPRASPAFVRRLAGRIPTGVPAERLTTFPAFGLQYGLRRAWARSPEEHTAVSIWAGRHLSRAVLRRGFGAASAVFGYSGECREVLAAARAAGLGTVVEQVIAPRAIVERLHAEECDRFGDWAATPEPDRAAVEYEARERAEWASADVILCGSAFVRDGIVAEGGPAGRCVVVPYGVDHRFLVPARRPHAGPLRVLTVGQVGLRKGSPYVVEAARRMRGRATFRLVGAAPLPEATRSRIAAEVDLAGPVPRSEMLAQFAWADVFLLPSLCEGSATAVYEALAAGLPVVCTPNTGSVVRHGHDGFVVPLRDVDAIVAALDHLSADLDARLAMAEAARATAQTVTVAAYGRRLLRAMDPVMRPGRADAPSPAAQTAVPA